jgi:hypothetical protein
MPAVVCHPHHLAHLNLLHVERKAMGEARFGVVELERQFVERSSGNVNNSYMTWLGGVGYRHAGARGLMATDAALGGVGGLILFAVARHFVKRQSTPEPKRFPV